MYERGRSNEQMKEVKALYLIHDLQATLEPLILDVAEAERLFEADSTQYNRRAYVRAGFAFIEGTIWLVKNSIIKLLYEGVKIDAQVTEREFNLLWEIKQAKDANGDVKGVTTQFVSLVDNLRFTMKMANKVYINPVLFENENAAYDRLKDAIEVRNRITHPKFPGDLDVKDKDITTCNEVVRWFNTILEHLYPLLIHADKKRQESLAS